MKKSVLLLCFWLTVLYTTAQTPPATISHHVAATQAVTETVSNWLFIQSDKALQYRFKLVKQEDEVGYFQVELRINFEDQIFCKHETCVGYLLVLGYPTLDNQKTIETSYMVYNSFKNIHTLPDLIPIKLAFADGSKRMLKPDGFVYTTADDATERQARVFSGCVDNMLSDNPDHRCKRDFKAAEAIVIK